MELIVIAVVVVFAIVALSRRRGSQAGTQSDWRSTPNQYEPLQPINRHALDRLRPMGHDAIELRGASNQDEPGRLQSSGGAARNSRKKRPDFDIVYTNRHEVMSRRVVRVRQIEYVEGSDSCTYLSADCDLTGELRTFRADRIIEMIDMQTGEVVAEPAKHLMKYAGKIIKSRSAGDRRTSRAFLS